MTERLAIPEVTDVDIAFPAMLPQMDEFIALAQERGWRGREWSDPACVWASEVFFKGGAWPELQEGVTDEEGKRAYRYVRALLGSYRPKHEDKIATVGMLMADYAVFA